MKIQPLNLFYRFMWYPVVFGLGMLFAGFLYYRLTTPQMWWAKDHPKEVDWAHARYDLYQKAAGMLYFQDEKGTGVTIVRPSDMPVK
ncbi:MAG: hypothetical protein KGJ89_05305 [Patescibacteria group bacterium]|nr:hypothetical protein [Patescibacteria group bacterium]MDE2015851.1 hypothetical protein [Patescibacteria group bacterium]MDE2227340.1 hypothetical protein [Patescibacteria group bacterium]